MLFNIGFVVLRIRMLFLIETSIIILARIRTDANRMVEYHRFQKTKKYIDVNLKFCRYFGRTSTSFQHAVVLRPCAVFVHYIPITVLHFSNKRCARKGGCDERRTDEN